MCLISQYYVYKASRFCLLCFLCHPYIPHHNLLVVLGIYTHSAKEFLAQNAEMQGMLNFEGPQIMLIE